MDIPILLVMLTEFTGQFCVVSCREEASLKLLEKVLVFTFNEDNKNWNNLN